jgi:curved DNA-binding protein CbpA
MSANYYSILGVPQNATTDQVRTRFLELAQKLHPDRFRGDEKEEAERNFQEITEAFNILSNPSRRREHDQQLARPVGEQTGPDPEQLVKIYMQRGVKAYREKQYSAAADNFQRATQTEPTNAKAWYHVALACSHQDRWTQQAMAAIERACELEPLNGRYAKFAGKLFEKGGKLEQAEQFYDKALRWGGEDEDVRAALENLSQKRRKGLSGFFRKNH